MNKEQDKEWRKMTFSQREDESPLPEILEIGKLSKEFRIQVWFGIDKSIEESFDEDDFNQGDGYSISSDEGIFWRSFYPSYHLLILLEPHDTAEKMPPWIMRRWLRNLVIDSSYHETLTVLEHILRSPKAPKNLISNIENCFNKYSLYYVDKLNDSVCVFPAASKETKESISRSLDNIDKSNLDESKACLRESAQELNLQNFPDSIRESINAVESAVRLIDPKNSDNFNDALETLEKSGMLKHKALKKAFSTLYGYASDLPGGRHPKVFSGATDDVGLDEAIFMFGACVSFIDYLVSKKRKMK